MNRSVKMARSLIPLALAAMLAVTGTGAPLAGFVLTSYQTGGYNTPASDTCIAEMADTAVQTVEVMYTYYVTNSVNSTNIFARPGSTPTDADVLRAIQQVYKNGMKVAMKPHIDCEDGIWRANIGVKFTTGQQWTDWFSNYTAFVLHAVDLLQQANLPASSIAGFNVGTELDGTHHRETQWRAVIAAVRAKLGPSVPLWLGPNWSWNGQPGYQLVNFWDALDYLGVDMYAPLSSHDDPTIDEAVAGWQPLIANLSAFWQGPFGNGGKKGFIFAEIGYASFQGAATNAPACCSGAPDPTTQAILYQSFFKAVWGQPWMVGVFWWAWPSDMPGGSACNTGFDIYGKPAADVLKACYTGSAGCTAPSPSGGQHAVSAAVRQTWPQAVIAKTTGTVQPGQASSGSAAPLTIYANGQTSWDDWSWGAVTNLTDTTQPYPGHSASISVNVSEAGGAFVLHIPSGVLNVSSYSSFEFDVVMQAPSANLSYALTAFFCACTDCSRNCGPQLPTVQVVDYGSSVTTCSVPSSWSSNPSAAHVSIPLSTLMSGHTNITIARVQVGANGAGAPVAYRLDNIQMV